MQRYGGELIYHGRDAEGVFEVVDTHGVRSLHFGTAPKQSALSIQHPNRLELAYVRAMLSALLFIEDPVKVLLIGLGGGTMARFLLGQFPGCRVDAVERRAGVVEIAHAYFGLPRTARLDVHVGEANQRVASLASQRAGFYDMILIDAYDHLGMDSSVNALDFLDDCVVLLHPKGVLGMNLWGSHPVSLKQSLVLLRTCFAGTALRLAVPNRGNVIGLGLGKQTAAVKLKQLEPRARELEVRTGLEMPYFLRNFKSIQ
jgi:spermidine synthase